VLVRRTVLVTRSVLVENVLVDEGGAVMEVGGFDGRADEGEDAGDEAMLGCNVGSIESGSRGLLGVRLVCQNDHRLEWCEGAVGSGR
jgi:hypothetical protein